MTVNSAKTDRLAQLLAERANRSTEALKLFRPLPTQLHACRSKAKENSLRGGNRSGKSTLAAVLTAAVATQTSLTGFNGEVIPPLYEVGKDEAGKPVRPRVIWVVGYDSNHIGKTIYRLLFRAGVFDMIRDLHTKEWRAYQPWNPEDVERKSQAKPAPPLIPQRLIDPKGWAWEDKANREFKLCRLLDGTEIRAMSSKAEEWQGDKVDWIWIDEDIYRGNHYQEWRMRTADTSGKMLWSYFPKGRNWAARDLSNRAKEQQGKSEDVREFILTFSANPFIDADQKRMLLQGMSDTERRARDLGEFITDDTQMYPNFSEFVHGTPKPAECDDTKLDSFLRHNGNEPGADWTRYLVLDPGHTLAAVLFAAVPPKEFGDHVVLFDELYLERHDADQLAVKVRDKIGAHNFEAFIIDDHAGRITPMGYAKGQTVKQHYVDAFRKYRVASLSTGHTFIAGSDNIAAGIEAVRTWLTIRSCGTSKLQFIPSRVPNFKQEMEMYSKQKSGDGVVLDEPAPRQRDHLCDTLRYLAAYDPKWKRPPAMRTVANKVDEMKKWINSLLKQQEPDTSIHLGPAGRTSAA